MKSLIYNGTIYHKRYGAHEHAFSYPIFMFAVNLQELNAMGRGSALFGHNRFSLFSIHDQDYLPGDGTISERVARSLKEQGIESPFEIHLVTMPRFFGYIFNPVSFIICRTEDGAITALIIQVNNTFGESHLYSLKPAKPTNPPVTFEFSKEFYVSPFFDVSGGYQVRLNTFGNEMDLEVNLSREEQPVFAARLAGTGFPISIRRLLTTLCTFPLSSLITMLRIEKHAVRLHFGRGAPVYSKPIPRNAATFKVKPKMADKFRLAVLAFWRHAADSSNKNDKDQLRGVEK